MFSLRRSCIPSPQPLVRRPKPQIIATGAFLRQRQALNDLAGAEAAVADPQVRQTPDGLGRQRGVKRPRHRTLAGPSAVHLGDGAGGWTTAMGERGAVKLVAAAGVKRPRQNATQRGQDARRSTSRGHAAVDCDDTNAAPSNWFHRCEKAPPVGATGPSPVHLDLPWMVDCDGTMRRGWDSSGASEDRRLAAGKFSCRESPTARVRRLGIRRKGGQQTASQ